MADALIDAVEKNDVPLVKNLIERGVDVNVVDRDGVTALIWAARKGFRECAKLLLGANADVEKANRFGWAPLHHASRNGHTECVKVWWCENFSFCGGKRNLTLSFAQLLIDWKANVNAKTIDGSSSLHLTAVHGHLACVEVPEAFFLFLHRLAHFS